MRLFLLIFLFFVPLLCSSQEPYPVSRIDTLLPFLGNTSLRSVSYDNRVVPFGSNLPLYVLVSYKESKFKHYEYFRVDSNRYLVYQFFQNGLGSRNEGLKSRGVVEIKNRIGDSSKTTLIGAGRGEFKYSTAIHYYKQFSKEGEWDEFEDSTFHHIYWTGSYVDNMRSGIWKRIVYGIGDDFVLEERDYGKDSTQKIYSSNIINTIPLDSLNIKLVGRWRLRSCDEENGRRMFYSKCETYNGAYGDDCNNNWAKENYYDFVSKTKFVRQRGEGCYKFRENCKTGLWKIAEINGQRFIVIEFNNGQTWRLKLLYIDQDNNLITDRQ